MYFLLLVLASCDFVLAQWKPTEMTLSVMYAPDPASTLVASQCLRELFPRSIYKYPVHIYEKDVACILGCIFTKFGIMDSNGDINLKNYNKRVEAIHRHDPRIMIADIGPQCVESMGENISGDVEELCSKAKAFNDCTQLYAVAFQPEQGKPIQQVGILKRRR